MSFANGSFVTIFKVEDRGHFSICSVSSYRRDPKTGNSYMDFTGIVGFYGNAHKQRPLAGQYIKITNCCVTNVYYDTEGKRQYQKTPSYSIFGYELQDSEKWYKQQQGDSLMPSPIDDYGIIPF